MKTSKNTADHFNYANPRYDVFDANMFLRNYLSYRVRLLALTRLLPMLYRYSQQQLLNIL